MVSKLSLNVDTLKELRKTLCLSQEDMAYACEQRHLRVSIATIKRAESGKLVSYRTARELAAFFNVELDSLLLAPAVTETEHQLPTQADAPKKHVLTVLWIRLENNTAVSDVLNLLQCRGIVWHEQLGNTLLASFGNYGVGGKGYLHAQRVVLEIKKLLLSQFDRPMHFYAALQLDSAHHNLAQSGLTPQLLQWFAKYSSLIPVDNIIVESSLYLLSNSHFSYKTCTGELSDVWLLQNELCTTKTLPLVGRSAELLQINAILDGVSQCSIPAITHITGQGGIGKSRLLGAVHEQCSLREILIADIDLEADWNDPMQLLTMGLCQRLYQHIETRWPEHQIRDMLFNPQYSVEQQLIFAELLDIEPPELNDYLPWQVEKVADEKQLLSAMASIFSCFIDQQVHSLVISIDNFHLAEHSGFRLLSRLLAQCQQLPLTVILTSRIETAVGTGLQQLVSEGYKLSTISLGPLSKQDVGTICSSVENLDENYKQRCIDLAEGVPLYLVQLLTSPSEQKNAVPSSLQILVEEKQQQLNQNDRRVVELLSVCDAPLPLASVAELLQQNNYSPAHLLNIQLVKVDSDNRIKLYHQLVQHIVYQGLSEKARCAYHGVLAEYVEQCQESLQNIQAYSLARHFEHAGNNLKAAYYNNSSATKLLQKGMYTEALELLNKALALLDSVDAGKSDDLEITLQLALCGIYKVKYGWVSPLLKCSYERVVDLCEQREPDKRLAMALFGLWAIELSTLNFQNAEMMADRCLAHSKQLDDKQGSMHAYIALSNTLFWRGKHKQAEQAAEQALALYHPSNTASSIQLLGQDPRALAGCFGAWSASLLGETEKAESYRRNSLADARQLQHDFSLAIAVQGSTWLDFHHGKPAEALNQAEELEALSIKMDFPFYRGVAALFIGWARHKLNGDVEAATIVDHGYHQWLASSGDKIAYSLFCTILGEIYIDTERYEDARSLLENGISFAIEHNEDCYLPEMYRFLSYCVDGSQRESYLQQGLNYATESPLFAARINAILNSIENDTVLIPN